MTNSLMKDLAATIPAVPEIGNSVAIRVAAQMLSNTLGSDWEVDQETDYNGETSVVVFPLNEVWGSASFILFERQGCYRVAVIRREAWERDRGFASLSDAATALIATAIAIGANLLEPLSELAVTAA